MSRYLAINLAILSIPFLFSFWKPVSYYRRWPALLFAFLTAGTAYIVWDGLVSAGAVSAAWDGWAKSQHWGFNPEYLLGIKILSLPLEEILFFVAAPYSSIFIYESLRAFSREKRVPFPMALHVVLAAGFFAAAAVFNGQGYTQLAMISCGLFFAASAFLNRDMVQSRHYWLFILIAYLPFLIFNHLLTAPPVVVYNPEAIWGIRILSIPLEDFFYNYSMLSFYLLAFLAVRNKWILSREGGTRGPGFSRAC
jgi:lycopene cyclase domain-containing protein